MSELYFVGNVSCMQANALAAELAIVEPYARRWRYIVQQRRRARVATGSVAGWRGSSWWQAAAPLAQAPYSPPIATTPASHPVQLAAPAAPYLAAQRGAQSERGTGGTSTQLPATFFTTLQARHLPAAGTAAVGPGVRQTTKFAACSPPPPAGQNPHSSSSQAGWPRTVSEPNRIPSPLSSPATDFGAFQISPQDFMGRSRHRPAARRPDFFMHSLSDPTHSLQQSGDSLPETLTHAQHGLSPRLTQSASQRQPSVHRLPLDPQADTGRHGDIPDTVHASNQRQLGHALSHHVSSSATRLQQDASLSFAHLQASELTNRYLQLLPHPTSQPQHAEQRCMQHHNTSPPPLSLPQPAASSSAANHATGGGTRLASVLHSHTLPPCSSTHHISYSTNTGNPAQQDFSPQSHPHQPAFHPYEHPHEHQHESQQETARPRYNGSQLQQNTSHTNPQAPDGHHHSQHPHPNDSHSQQNGSHTHHGTSHTLQHSHQIPTYTSLSQRDTPSALLSQRNTTHHSQKDDSNTYDLDAQMQSIELVLRQCQMLKSQAKAVSDELEYNAGLLETAHVEQMPAISNQRTVLLQRLTELTAELEMQRPMVVMAAGGIRRLREAQGSGSAGTFRQ